MDYFTHFLFFIVNFHLNSKKAGSHHLPSIYLIIRSQYISTAAYLLTCNAVRKKIVYQLEYSAYVKFLLPLVLQLHSSPQIT